MDERLKKGRQKKERSSKIKILEKYISVDPSMIDLVIEMMID